MSYFLDDLAREFKTTKREHPHYIPIYNKVFAEKRLDVKKVLEIGVQGGGSIKMWEQYFPHAEISGIDVLEKCKKHKSDRIKIFIGNQEDKDFLGQFKGYDIIIDDGGHTMKQQKRSFMSLFKGLNPGGIYVIEDLHTSYWPEFGGEFRGKKTAITMLKGLVDSMNSCWYKNHSRAKKEKYEPEWLDNQIEYVHFYKSICFIGKI